MSKHHQAEKRIAWQKLQKISALTGYEKITTDVKIGTDIELLVEESIKEKQADLLAMFPKEKSFYKQLFKGSVTDDISLQIAIPLLAIKKK